MPTDFEEEVEEHVEPEPDTPAPRDADGIPYCRDHHCRMKQSSGGRKASPTRYYACPVPKCECKAQLIKTRRESVVPPQPLTCSRCSTEKKPVYCKRVPERSGPAYVILQCPQCGWRSNAMAVPQLAAQHYEQRRKRGAVEGIGGR